MPYRRKTPYKRRSYKKYVPRKRYSRRKQTNVNGRQLSLSSQLVKLKYYSYNESLTISSGVYTSKVWLCNGMQDPDLSGGGHQPRGYDQWTLFYNHYTVIGCKATVTFVTTSDATADFRVGVSTRATSSLEDAESYMENYSSSAKLLAGGNNSKAVVKKYFSTKKYFKRSPLGDNSLKAVFTANPSELAYFHIFAFPLDATSSATLKYDIQLEYIAILSEPKVLAIS